VAQKVTVWEWTDDRLLAAELLAEDRLSDAQIAAEVGVNRRTLARWKGRPEFADKAREFAKALEAAILTRGIASRVNRVRALDRRRALMERVILERGGAPGMADVPGGSTGLLVRRLKGIGGGENYEVVEEFEFDAALVRELRETEKQAAQELGQWTERRSYSGPDGGPIPVQHSLIDPEAMELVLANRDAIRHLAALDALLAGPEGPGGDLSGGPGVPAVAGALADGAAPATGQ
jgi:Homeodomain-like domain